MIPSRKPVSVLMVLVVTLSLAPDCSGDVLHQFADASVDALLSFPEFGGNNSSLSVEIPAKSLVANASIDIEGREQVYGGPGTVTDFAGPPNKNLAFSGTTASLPPVGIPATFESTNITVVPEIKLSDNVWYKTSSITVAPYHLFEMYVGIVNLVSFNLTWEGIGFSDPQMGFGSNQAKMYLWNNASTSWSLLANNGTGEVPQEVEVKAQVSSQPGNYVDAKGYINAFVTCNQQSSNRVETDYIKLQYFGIRTVFPSNPSLDVAANGTTEWSQAGKLTGKATFSGAAFVSALQAELDKQATGTVSITLKFRVDDGGFLFVSNLTIEYGEKDLPPSLNKTIPTLDMDEDTAAVGLIDLLEYFTDDGGAAGLTFSVVFEENASKLHAAINNDGHRVDFTPKLANWNGMVQFRVRATDARAQFAESNNFTVFVHGLNDPPVLRDPGVQKATQDVAFELYLNASDPDTPYDQDETLAFSTNSTLVIVDIASGRAHFVPRNKDVGSHRFAVTVTDHAGANDTKTLVLQVDNVNDPPVLSPLEDVTVTEDLQFEVKARATDPDLALGLDTLSFSDNTTLFDIAADGTISFLPKNADVGAHMVSVTVRDLGGLSDTKNFTITIAGVNDAPTLQPIDDIAVDEDTELVLRVNATDQDFGDTLTFKDDTPLFDINSTGWIRFTPRQKDVGVLRVKITVTDRAGASANASFNITVRNVNDPPVNVTIVQPLNGTTFTEGKSLTFTCTARDDDGDKLNFTWYDNGKVLGTGATLNKGLKAGKHTITVTASDGQSENSSRAIVITVKAPTSKGFLPGFEGITAVCVLAVVTLLLRKKG